MTHFPADRSLDLPAATLRVLKFRAKLLNRIRSFFDDQGYFEVETPLLSRDIVVDAHLEPILVEGMHLQTCNDPRPLFLQTSPEFAMKRMLVAGADAIYQICHAFRDEEWGTLHNPEFSMLEWYRVGDSYRDQMDFVELLFKSLIEQLGNENHFDSSRTFERISYDEAFEKYAGLCVPGCDVAGLKELASKHELQPPESLSHKDSDDWLNYLLAELVEPNLGKTRPTFLYDYPASQAALAGIRPDEPPVAERFELYLDGLEICNGYRELTDAEELKRRQIEQNRKRKQLGRRELPMENRLLEAMQRGLPECSGVALGIDRLAMYLLGVKTLSETIAFPFDRC